MSDKELEAIFGKDSSNHREATILNSIEHKTIIEEDKDEPLSEALKQAMHLKDEVKKRYIYIAGLYLEDMQRNIFKNQFELNKTYPTVSIDEWNDFLTDRIVSVYINKHKRTLLKAAAEDNLANPVAKNKRDNLQLIRNIEEQEQNEQNKNICIIRIPDIYDEES